MARASTIWLVYREPNHDLLAAFTVKKEAMAWIGKKLYNYSGFALTRIPDGGWGEEAHVEYFRPL